MKPGDKTPTPLEDLKRFFEILDTTEESDGGNIFHPVNTRCCRVMTGIELEGILKRLKARANMTSPEWNQALGD